MKEFVGGGELGGGVENEEGVGGGVFGTWGFEPGYITRMERGGRFMWRAWAVIYILIAEIRVPKPEVGVGMEVPGKGDLRCR